jgi:hypothetical protein
MRYKLGFSAVLSAVLICHFSYAALHETVRGPDESPTVINVDGSLVVGGGQALPGFDLGLSTRLASDAPLYIGADFGVYVSTASPSFALIPILGSLYYQFEPYSSVHPLLGVLVGPTISTGGGYSDVNFEALVRPGLNIALGSTSLNMEARFGVIGPNFVFAPQIGATFAM